ncbi:hypothetical protein BGZ65_007124, partial [Modicella reniformis]
NSPHETPDRLHDEVRRLKNQIMMTIWCVVDGESSVFHVDIPADQSVSHLKAAIKKAKRPAFNDIVMDRLTLWKVSKDPGQKYKLQNLRDDQKELLDPEHPISLVRDNDIIIAQPPLPVGIMNAIEELKKTLSPNRFNTQAIKYKQYFTIANAFLTISQDLELADNQPLYLFLHIDEFQRIFEFPWKGSPHGKAASPLPEGIRMARNRPSSPYGDRNNSLCDEGANLFKDMMRHLGPFMGGKNYPLITQPFLSGTAQEDVILVAEPTFYSFKFIDLPLLSLGACYTIMGHFTQGKVPYSEWMPKMEYFQLITATGGLPRAMQYLLEVLFGYNLELLDAGFGPIDYSETFMKVANKIDDRYYITSFARKHHDIIRALTRLCILQKESQRTGSVSGQYTLDTLERQTHTILENSKVTKGMVFVRIPYFFLHLYNCATKDISGKLNYAFLKDWNEEHEWNYFEHFIAEYEVFRTNLLVDDDHSTMTLKSLYQGAHGVEETLNHEVKLSKLTFSKATRRFPQTSPKKRKGSEEDMNMDWTSNVVIKNAAGASFGDVCVYRDNAKDEKKTLFALQAKKWTTNNVTLKTIEKEHQTNCKAVESAPEHFSGVKDTRLITVMITTCSYTGDVDRIPPDCLLIHKGNFAEYFGDIFSFHAALSMAKNSNWNFLTREFLRSKLPEEKVQKVLDNMPYHTQEDIGRVLSPSDMKEVGDNMGFLPYEDFRPKKKRRTA